MLFRSQLELAVKNFFGQEVKINLVTFDEQKDVKKKLNPSPDKTAKEEFQPNIGEEETAIIDTIQIEQNFDIEIEELEEKREIKTETPPAKVKSKKFSDETEMIMELFQGKVID